MRGRYVLVAVAFGGLLCFTGSATAKGHGKGGASSPVVIYSLATSNPATIQLDSPSIVASWLVDTDGVGTLPHGLEGGFDWSIVGSTTTSGTVGIVVLPSDASPTDYAKAMFSWSGHYAVTFPDFPSDVGVTSGHEKFSLGSGVLRGLDNLVPRTQYRLVLMAIARDGGGPAGSLVISNFKAKFAVIGEATVMQEGEGVTLE